MSLELIKQPTNSTVDLNAAHYKEHSELQQTLAGQILDTIDFSPEANVLDVGCGDGRITAFISQKVPHGSATGIDSSKSMIDSANQTYLGSNYSHLKFVQLKAEDYDIDAKFDNVVSFSCFHWIRKARQALTKLSDSLIAGGRFTLLTYPSESKFYEFMQQALDEAYPDYAKKSAYNTMLSIQDYKSTIQNSGLKIHSIDRKDLFTKHENFQELKEFIRGWLTSFVPLPTEFHEDYLDLVIEKCQPYLEYSPEGSVQLPYTELIIDARKH